MIAEILSIGTELLMGQIANTDAQYISRRLGEMGICLYRHSVVGDNTARVKQALAEALSRADIVITTGGLGPTEDDLTKETVAEAFGLPMLLDAKSLCAIEDAMRRFGREMTPNNRKQAYFPQGAIILPNRCGTAPGCILEKDGRMVAILPGPPFEMQDMFENALAPHLEKRGGGRIVSRFYHEFGIGESKVEVLLSDLFHSSNPTLALYCGNGEVTARLSARVESEAAAHALLKPVEDEIIARLGDAYYGEGRDLTLNEAVLQTLLAAQKTVAFAESCTGGLMAARLIDGAGASSVLKESYVTYSNEAKMKLLGVRPETIAAYTEVSAQCAREMAAGVRKAAGSDYGVSVTGVAGPDGGSEKNPVGTVYIGIADAGNATAYEFHFSGSRARVRLLACMNGFNLLRKHLNA